MTKEAYAATGDSFEFGYNGAGLRSSMKTAGANEYYAYSYDTTGRLTRVYTSSSGRDLATFQYDEASGRLMTRVSGVTYLPSIKPLRASYSYDASGRLTRVHNQGLLSGAAQQAAVGLKVFDLRDIVISIHAIGERTCQQVGQIAPRYARQDRKQQSKPHELASLTRGRHCGHTAFFFDGETRCRVVHLPGANRKSKAMPPASTSAKTCRADAEKALMAVIFHGPGRGGPDSRG